MSFKMRLKNVPPGSRIRHPDPQLAESWVVVGEGNHSNDPHAVLLGWKAGEKYPSQAWDAYIRPQTPGISDYTYCWWAAGDETVEFLTTAEGWTPCFLEEIKAGSRIGIYTDQEKMVVRSVPTSIIIPTLVVSGMGTCPTDAYSDCVLLGWKSENDFGSGWKPCRSSSHLCIPNMPADCAVFLWVTGDLPALLMSTPSYDPGGMFCRGCKNFSSYAVPNRPSNNFVCYSCRQGFVPDEW